VNTPELSLLVAAREAAWMDLDALQRDLPCCEHVQAWQAEIRDAQRRHREAVRAVDRAMTQAAKAPPEPAGEPLFDIEGAAL
jgi:hypothetical protein